MNKARLQIVNSGSRAEAPHFRPILAFLMSKPGLTGVFALFCAFFQIFLLSRAPLFYHVLRLLFAVLTVQLVAAFIRAASKQKLLWLALLLIVLVRVPFYLHADGAMLTSDNACDALQAVEMRDTHTAPHFLLGAVKHMGTIKYLVVAFLMDAAGNRYLAYLLVQALLFVCVLFALYDLLKDSVHPPALFGLLFLTQFAFFETVFDYSLSLRGAPYLEMLFFAVLGAGLVDRQFRSAGRTFLGYYFLFFAIYIHPLGAIFVGCFGLVFLVYSIVRRRFLFNALLAAAGSVAGLYHWFYYLLFLPKPVAGGAWEQIGLVPLAQVSFRYLIVYFRALKETFSGLINFEFSYLSPIFNAGRIADIETGIDRALIWISLAVTASVIILSLRKILRLVRRRDALRNEDWPWLLAGVLAGTYLAKLFLLYPPHTEPRHNFDLLFLILLSYILFFSALLRRERIRSWGIAAGLAAALAATIPHYGTFLEVVRDKEAAYGEILSVLRTNQVRYLTTDFIVAYPIYFLSGRKIRVTDSLGPFTVRDFFPNLRAEVDAVPPDRKAYLFFRPGASDRPWHKDATRVVFQRTIESLDREGISYRMVKLRDYVIVVPQRRSGRAREQGEMP